MLNISSKIIGKGLQYIVYDIGQTRVLKRQTTRFSKIFTLIKWGNYNPIKIYKDILVAEKITRNSISSLAKISNYSQFSFLGHPVIGADLNYRQDRVIPFAEYFSTHDLEENKKIINLYVQNIFKTWTNGFSDTVYNFTINNGVSNSGEVILIDLGELSFDKREVLGYILSQSWLRTWSYKQISSELKEYFKNKMESEITESNLEKFWHSSN
jgi:hypothetical protein